MGAIWVTMTIWFWFLHRCTTLKFFELTEKVLVCLRCFGCMCWFPSCPVNSTNVHGLNLKGDLLYVIHSPTMTLESLPLIYLSATLWTGRGRRAHRVYRKVFGKWAVGFWKGGARGRPREGGRGISESVFVTVYFLLIQQEEAWVSECAKEADIPKDERLALTSDGEIRPLSYTSKGRRK